MLKRVFFVVLSVTLVACGGDKSEPPATPDQTEKPAPTEVKTPTPSKVKTVTPSKVRPPEEPVTPPNPHAVKPAVPEEAGLDTPDPVAIVNGEPLPAAKFNKKMSRYLRPGLKIPKDRLTKVKTTLLDRLIDDQLILQAAKKGSVEIDAKRAGSEYEKYTARFRSKDHFDNYLKHTGLSVHQIKGQIRVRLLLEGLLEKHGVLKVDQAEAKKFYEGHPNLYKQRETIHARHVLVKVSKKADAAAQAVAKQKLEKIQGALQSGTSFEDVARAHSEGPSGPKGGDLGFFGRGQMVKEFEEVAFSLKPGIVSHPVRTVFGWHIIKVDEKKEGRMKKFEEVNDQLVESLKRKQVAVEKRKLLKVLRAQATVERKGNF